MLEDPKYRVAFQVGKSSLADEVLQPPTISPACDEGAAVGQGPDSRLQTPRVGFPNFSPLANYRVRLPLPGKGSGLASLQSSTSNA